MWSSKGTMKRAFRQEHKSRGRMCGCYGAHRDRPISGWSHTGWYKPLQSLMVSKKGAEKVVQSSQTPGPSALDGNLRHSNGVPILIFAMGPLLFYVRQCVIFYNANLFPLLIYFCIFFLDQNYLNAK